MMPALVVSCIVLTLVYAVLMLLYRRGWQRQKEFKLPANFEPSTFISIIIPARNEAANIGGCIDAILAQKYPKELFEIIVIDDHSEDSTAAIVYSYDEPNIQCLHLARHIPVGQAINAYKKVALSLGIAHSKGDLVITTDADCLAPNAWLLHMAAMYQQQKPAMILAPVIFSTDHSVLQSFQLTDFMSMQGITAAAHALKLGNMSNGANLAFSREAYDKINGYEGTTHLASGDDYLLTLKIHKQFLAGVAYLKSPQVIVRTLPQLTWRAFLQQRIRWASKSGKYNDHRLTAILVLVYLFNLLLLSLAVAGFVHTPYWYLALAVFAVKVIVEYAFVIPVARFFRQEWVLRYFVMLQPLHIVYIVLAGFLGFFGSYQWKGRTVK